MHFTNFIAISFSIELFLWMLGSFLIGYLFAMVFYSKGISNPIENLEPEIQNTGLQEKNFDDEPLELIIRARKTVDRGGIEVKKPERLNFKRIGTASEDDKDDLSKIKGVGSFIEKKLNSIGIFTYKQISNFTEKDIETVTNLIQFFPGRIKRDNWKAQAEQLLKAEE
ncbi:hypothetical protein [uncultured Tenacibaculum sp.]|uniref:hypothetical protein n=1 Tax=uncultured Tenacibaculum sp. TaxID=174713 RepID=UPI002614509A|nr:hypothetical protein [uncultured Tenacibaculum sp.]